MWAPERGCLIYEDIAVPLLLTFQVALVALQILLLVWLKDILVAVWLALSGGGMGGVEEQTMQSCSVLEGTPEKTKAE